MKLLRRPSQAFIAFVLLLAAQAAAQQGGKLDIAYTVALSDPATRQFHVTTDIKNINQPKLDLALPTWTPGWYVVENYGKNVLRFKVTDEKGRRLPFRMSRKQTWNIDTKGVRQIRVEYDYAAVVLALNQAKIADDFAFFTGIELFLEPLGHRDSPGSVKFEIPQGWAILSALKETTNPMIFSAADYDTLVDSPTIMGKFDVTRFNVDGKQHSFAAYPAGAFSAEKTARFTDMLGKTALAEKKIFGELPYDKFVYFYFFAPPESNASGALEHSNSFVAFASAGSRATPEQLITTGAHEFFHLWNVKRIRPMEMWPYDYAREQETPLLWVSEGFTNYYSSLSIYRAGIISESDWLSRVAGAAAGVENTEARKYISPANASVSTWVGYDSPVAFGISYYTQGQNLAALLDLSIRNDTDGNASLDDVMRTLYTDFYKRGRGYTSDDFIGIVNKLTKKDYRGFFESYVFGVEVPDYDKIFGYAGLKLERKSTQTPEFGFNGRMRDGGFRINSVEPNSPADKAGLRSGDLISRINGEAPQTVQFGALAGQTIKLTVKRGESESEATMDVGARDFTSFLLSEDEGASQRQKSIRAGWLKQ